MEEVCAKPLRLRDTFFYTGLEPEIWVSRREEFTAAGVWSTLRWRLVRTKDLGNGAFRVIEDLVNEAEIKKALEKELAFEHLPELDKLLVSDMFEFSRIELFEGVMVDKLDKGPVIVSLAFDNAKQTMCSKLQVYRDRFRTEDSEQWFKARVSKETFRAIQERREKLELSWPDLRTVLSNTPANELLQFLDLLLKTNSS